MKHISLFLLLLLSLILSHKIESTHFRGGSISLRPVDSNGTYIIVEFSTYFAWRRDFDKTTHCDDQMIVNRTKFAPSLSIICDSGCSQPNEIIGDTSIACSSYSETDNWSLGQNLFNYSLPANRSVEISFKGSFWIELAQLEKDRHNAHWELRAKFTTTTRNDTMRLNTSPITMIPPIIRVQLGRKHSIKIPTADLDDDLVKCRWSQSNECGSICQTIKNANLNSNCTLEFDATDARLGWYAVAIQIEDFKSLEETQPLSSIPIQFLILVEDGLNGVECKEEPRIIEPLDTCYVGQIGVAVKKVVIARSDCDNVGIKEIQVLGPMGSLKSKTYKLNNSQNSQLWFSNISWTPFNKGVYLICVSAIDSNMLKSNLSCFTIIVDVLKPHAVFGTQQPLNVVDSRVKSNDFSVYFDSFSIQKPFLRAAFIRLYSDETSKELTKLNTKESKLIHINMNQLKFNFNFSFMDEEWYYVLMDNGVVVGDDQCRPGSEHISDKTFWRFKFSKKLVSANKELAMSTSTSMTSRRLSDIKWLFDSKQCDLLSFITVLVSLSFFIVLAHLVIFLYVFCVFNKNKLEDHIKK